LAYCISKSFALLKIAEQVSLALEPYCREFKPHRWEKIVFFYILPPSRITVEALWCKNNENEAIQILQPGLGKHRIANFCVFFLQKTSKYCHFRFLKRNSIIFQEK